MSSVQKYLNTFMKLMILWMRLTALCEKNGHIVITVPFCNPEHETTCDFFRYTTYGITKKLEDHEFKVVKCKMLNTSQNAVRQVKILITIGDYFINRGYSRFFTVSG